MADLPDYKLIAPFARTVAYLNGLPRFCFNNHQTMGLAMMHDLFVEAAMGNVDEDGREVAWPVIEDWHVRRARATKRKDSSYLFSNGLRKARDVLDADLAVQIPAFGTYAAFMAAEAAFAARHVAPENMALIAEARAAGRVTLESARAGTYAPLLLTALLHRMKHTEVAIRALPGWDIHATDYADRTLVLAMFTAAEAAKPFPFIDPLWVLGPPPGIEAAECDVNKLVPPTMAFNLSTFQVALAYSEREEQELKESRFVLARHGLPKRAFAVLAALIGHRANLQWPRAHKETPDARLRGVFNSVFIEQLIAVCSMELDWREILTLVRSSQRASPPIHLALSLAQELYAPFAFDRDIMSVAIRREQENEGFMRRLHAASEQVASKILTLARTAGGACGPYIWLQRSEYAARLWDRNVPEEALERVARKEAYIGYPSSTALGMLLFDPLLVCWRAITSLPDFDPLVGTPDGFTYQARFFAEFDFDAPFRGGTVSRRELCRLAGEPFAGLNPFIEVAKRLDLNHTRTRCSNIPVVLLATHRTFDWGLDTDEYPRRPPHEASIVTTRRLVALVDAGAACEWDPLPPLTGGPGFATPGPAITALYTSRTLMEAIDATFDRHGLPAMVMNWPEEEQEVLKETVKKATTAFCSSDRGHVVQIAVAAGLGCINTVGPATGDGDGDGDEPTATARALIRMFARDGRIVFGPPTDADGQRRVLQSEYAAFVAMFL